MKRYAIPFDGTSVESSGGAPQPPPHTGCAPELERFRRYAPEFDHIDDKDVCWWIEDTRPMIYRRMFHRLTPHALALLTAWRLKMAADAMLEADGGIDPSRISSISGENASMSFSAADVPVTVDDAALKKNKYGLQYLALRQPVVTSL